MADWNSYDGSVGDEDYQEEEVWALGTERRDESPKSWRSKDASSSSTAKRRPSASRVIPRSSTHGEGHGRALRQSVPINIPDWGKIYGHKGSSERHSLTRGSRLADSTDEGDSRIANNDVEDDDEDEGKVPPHEWIARRLARSQISSFSVCEGAGRTLKGRDLSNVRNAVLTRTGFIE